MNVRRTTTDTTGSPRAGSMAGSLERSVTAISLALVAAFGIAPSVATADDTASAETPTFARDVAPIFQAHCQGCHRPGESAPMSLLSYEDARPWAKSIAKAVATGQMPPWFADPAVGKWANDRRLAPEEIDAVVRWARGGAPMGDPADLPEPRAFSEGWNIGVPDQIVHIALRPITIAADVEDEYRYFLVNPKFTEDVWIEAVEARPGNPSVVHHMLAKAVEPAKGVVDPETDAVGWIGSMTPGRPPDEFGEGLARFIKAGSLIGFEVHYHKEKGVAVTDHSMLGLRFAKGPVRQALNNMRIHWDKFRIPPERADYRLVFEERFQQDVHFHTIMPHMHTRARSMRVTAVYPDAREEVLLNVPRYDFNWQLTYRFAEPHAIPAGTNIRVEASYDNSPANPHNPDPTVEVISGEATTDEMMVAFIDYTVDAENLFEGKRVEPLPSLDVSAGEAEAGDDGAGGE